MKETIEIKDILDANAHNSAMALTAKWVETFRKYAMEDYEGLDDDPSSSFNIFTHLTAQGAAKMMYEQAARINETNVSTAILPKSLLNKITSEELAGIFGMPASTTIAFCIKKDEIISYGVYVPDEGVYRLKINKNLIVNFESYPSFTLPYDVIINAKPIISKVFNSDTGVYETVTDYNIYAYYDMPTAENDGMRHVFNIYNQYISSREMRFEGSTYVSFFLKVFQIERKEVEIYVSNPYTADSKVEFDNMLVGMEVFRKKINSTTETLMTGLVEGTSLYNNTYNYSYDTKRNLNNLNISFSKMNDNSALTIGDTIKIIVYTTQGSVGNIEFPYMIYNIDKLTIKYNQELTDTTQNAMLNIIALAFARDKASVGGKDSLTFEEIRSRIISKQYSRDILITTNEIIKKGKELGLSISKIQQDLTAMYYYCSDKLTYKNMILSTGTTNLFFDLKKKDKLLRGYNYYLIEPTDIFEFNPKINRYEYITADPSKDNKVVEPYMDYVNKYNTAVDTDAIRQVSFPFYMRFENTTNPKIQIYDMYINTTEYVKFTKYNESTALDKLDITYFRIIRNPFKGSISGSFDKNAANTIYMTFIVFTGKNTLNKLYLQSHSSSPDTNYVNNNSEDLYKKQYVTFELGIEGISNGRYTIDPTRVTIVNADTMVDDGYIAYQASIETNNFVSNDKTIQLKGIKNATSVSKDYTVFMPVETTVKFSITGKFNDAVNNPSNKECITYETDSVKLVDYLSDDFKIEFDIETVLTGDITYDADKFYKYESTIYYKNPKYDPTVEDPTKVNHYELKVESINGVDVDFKVDGNQSIPTYIVAHKTGETRFEYNEITEEEREAGPSEFKEYFVRKIFSNDNGNIIYDIDEENEFVYEKINIDNSFDENTQYYTKQAKIKHHKGDFILYDKRTGEVVDIPYNEGKENVNYETKPSNVEYTGICKNVPWVNRLYMSGEYMYETIHNLYLDIIDRTNRIKNNLFDGGKIFIGLNNTSGKSKKYKAYKLNDGSKENLNNIAMSFVFRVKYKEDTSLEYKEEQIKSAVISYINNIGEQDLSVDKLFDTIKSYVPDIVYINIEKMNNYKYGEVQTIVNDTSVTDEVLTVSQKMITTDTGDIDFEPDITVNVVQID